MSASQARKLALALLVCLGAAALALRLLSPLAAPSDEAPPAARHDAPAPAPIPVETVRRRVVARGGQAWDAAFDLSFDGARIVARVGVRLVPADGVGLLALRQAASVWALAVAETWSGRVALESGGRTFPVRVEIVFEGLSPSARPTPVHHQVVVRQGAGPSKALHWNLADPPRRVAHELGHLLGAYDEYRRGARDPRGLNLPDDTGTVMGAEHAGAIHGRPRHLWLIREWFEARAGTEASLVRFSSPASSGSRTGGSPAGRP
jgi:hypothetical protein